MRLLLNIMLLVKDMNLLKDVIHRVHVLLMHIQSSLKSLILIFFKFMDTVCEI